MSYSLPRCSSIAAVESSGVLAAAMERALLSWVPSVPCSKAYWVVEEPSAMVRVVVVVVVNTFAIVVLRACPADCTV